MRKKIKLKFVGFWPGFKEKDNIYYNILSEKFDVELTDEPDYIIATMYKGVSEYLKYTNCVRIFHSGEDYFPDFNLFDYAAGYDEFKLQGVTSTGMIDRYFRWPFGCEWNLEEINNSFYIKSEEELQNILSEKRRFCNYIYAHRSIKGKRERLLNVISEYKPVDSAGSYLNNMKNNTIIPFSKKIEFIKNYKFTIAAETLQYPGMTTEKIYDAYRANSIPIYFGNPLVKDMFDEDTFIYWDGSDEGIKQMLDRIKEIDNNDKLYRDMIMKQKVNDIQVIENKKAEFSVWLEKIFEIDKDDAMQHIEEAMLSQRGYYEKELKKIYGI